MLIAKKFRRIFGFAVFAAAISACSFTSADEPATGSSEAESTSRTVPSAPTISVEVTEVRRETLTESLELTGSVEPWDEFVVSPEITGRVTQLYVDEGDWVTEGQLLVELDRTERMLQKRVREAQVERARTELEFARKRLLRAESLLDRGAISESEVDTVREAVRLAQSSLAVAEVQLETIEEELKDTQIRAPETGQVSQRSVSIGETVSLSTPLLTVIQLNPVKVITEVTEPYLRVVRRGTRAAVYFPAYDGLEYQARVNLVRPVASLDSGAFPVEIRLPNPERKIQAGMIARVKLEGKVFSEVLVVPLPAIVNSDRENYVFSVEEGVARRLRVEVVERLEGLALVEGPLSVGQKVVVRGNNNLTEGTPVEVVN